MNAYTTRTFESDDGEAVRLPKEFGFGPDVEVEIVREGDAVTIRRKRTRMTNAELVEALRKLPLPGKPQKREKIIFPKRRGL